MSSDLESNDSLFAESSHDSSSHAALRAAALTVGCRYCLAQPGQPCINKHLKPPAPLRRQAAHKVRIDDADNELPF